MGIDLPPNWVANHDQREAELRDLVKPIVASIISVRGADDDEALEEGTRLAETLAARLAPLSQRDLLELLFLSLTKVAHEALHRYEERLEAMYEALDYAPGERDGGRDADGAEERDWSDPERFAED